ncbi:hypothetical protein ABHN11_21585 [Brevibacillus centrosporus]|uniref:hypothetical protein n=1 Tax=Brevibacillus centrosporus TaxID=54910 RepID=UPI0039872386
MSDQEISNDLVEIINERMEYLMIKQLNLVHKMNEILEQEGSDQRFEKGAVHHIFSRKRGMSLRFLIYACKALGFAEGEFFPEYISQYLIVRSKENPQKFLINIKKLREFVKVCLDRGLYEYCRLVVDKLKKVDNPPLSFLKDLAEDYEGLKLTNEAFYVYETITRLINHQLGEHSSVYLKKFLIQREMGLQQALESAIELGVYVKYMDEKIKQQAYDKLIATYFTLEDWDKVYLYCDEQVVITRGKNNEFYGNALVYKSNAARSKRDYKLALELIDLYSRLPEEHFKQWAEINRLNVYIEMGDTSVIPIMLSWIKSHPNNSPSNDPAQKTPFRSLAAILTTYVKQCELENISIFLRDFAEEISFLCAQTNPFDLKYACAFILSRAEYYFLLGKMSQGLDDVIQALSISITLKSDKDFAKCVWKYSMYSSHASPLQQGKYSELCATATKIF